MNLLQKIEMSDNKELISEMSRLETLEKTTSEMWLKNLDATEMSRLQALELKRRLEKQHKNFTCKNRVDFPLMYQLINKIE